MAHSSDDTRPAKRRAPEDRKHHTVSVCYLRAWQSGRGKEGLLDVERIKAGIVISRFKTKPNTILYRKGFYDMSEDLSPLPQVTASLLETNVFAEGMEAAFTKTRAKTLAIGKVPSVSQAAFLAEFCLMLYFRAPKFQRMIEPFVDAQGWNEFQKKVAKHPGARTLTLASSYW